MSTEKKLTAVEWLEQEIRWNVSNSDKLIEIFKQAKEKEKQNIIEACYYGSQYLPYEIKDKSKQYYNKTFKN